MRQIILAATLFVVLAGGQSLADESSIQLRQNAGVEAVEGNCGACHSLDYIQMNSPIQDEKGWTATVGKMVKVLGAPISEDDQKKIIAYLASNYAKK